MYDSFVEILDSKINCLKCIMMDKEYGEMTYFGP